MRSNIFKWITWIVIGLALCAGFAARAGTNLNPVIIIKTEAGRIQCKLRSLMLSGDGRVSAAEFNNYDECWKSPIYKSFKKDEKVISTGEPYVDTLPEEDPHPTITKYVKIFETKTGIPASHIKFYIGNTSGKAVGVCSMKKREITINKKYWEGDASEYDKELTIYHELGHCLLNRGHYNPLNHYFFSPELQKNCPKSIMYWQSYGSKDAYRCFHQHRPYYWRELLTGTHSIKVEKEGVKEPLMNFYIDPGLRKHKIGSFHCTTYTQTDRPKGSKTSTAIWYYISLECSRDKVIYNRIFRFFKTAIGKDAVRNLTIKAQNQIPITLILRDKILNETFTITVKKISPDLW